MLQSGDFLRVRGPAFSMDGRSMDVSEHVDMIVTVPAWYFVKHHQQFYAQGLEGFGLVQKVSDRFDICTCHGSAP